MTAELVVLDRELGRLTAEAAPALRDLTGVGPDVAGALLVAAGDNPERLRSDAAFASLCGVSPVPASSEPARTFPSATTATTLCVDGSTSGRRPPGARRTSSIVMGVQVLHIPLLFLNQIMI